jgi:hypothetical protein
MVMIFGTLNIMNMYSSCSLKTVTTELELKEIGCEDMDWIHLT